MTFIDAAELARLVSMEAAIDALDRLFGAERLPDAPPRTRLSVAGCDLLLMPASGVDGIGVKLVTVNPANPARGLPLIHGLYALFAPDALAPLAVIDGAALTGLRTAAVSGLATRYLARPDADRLVIFGAGAQARAHLAAMRAVRPISRLRVVSRTPDRAQELVAHARALGLDAAVAGPDAVGDADIVCACTTSPTPVFDGALPRRGRLVVETRAAALAEAGDLLIPLGRGVITASDIVADLCEVVRGLPVRRAPGDITVFKSVGLAVEDLAIATIVGRAGV